MDDRFLRFVHDLLEHFYDYPFLQRPTLGQNLPEGKLDFPRGNPHLLRQALLDAINRLKPEPGTPSHSSHWREYSALSLHYLEGLTVEDAASRLAVSRRQLYRDLRQGEINVANLLWVSWTRHEPVVAARAGEPKDDLVLREADRLGGRIQKIDVETLANRAVADVERLAERHKVGIRTHLAVGTWPIYTDSALIRHALISTLSYVVQNALPGTEVVLQVSSSESETSFGIQYTPSPERDGQTSVPVAAEQLVRRLGGDLLNTPLPSGEYVMSFTVRGQAQATVLVVDDNEGLPELFERYVAGEGYRLIRAANGEQGLMIAARELPDIVILDVMMPERDGWEVLQHFRNDEVTRDIPIVICSVLNDPELAFSLGAAHFLAKPVSREQLLTALRCCRQMAESPSHPATPADI